MNGFPLPEWFPCLFDEYQRQLLQANRADFASLLWLCHRILEERPVIARQFRTIYPHICIDEFQDTNLAQYRLLQAIVGSAPTDLFVVADDDQIIYQWNGASPERLQALRNDYGMHVVQLPQNYRCPAEVIRMANSLIRNNQRRAADKRPLEAMRPSGKCGQVRLFTFRDLESETRWLAQDLEVRGSEPASCVVIARTNQFLESAADALRQRGVPAQVMRRKSEFESTPFRWLHAGLRLANARHDHEQLRRLCKSWYELVGVDLRPNEIEAAATLLGGDFLRAWIDEVDRTEQGTEILKNLRDQLLERIDFLGFTHVALAWFRDLQKSLAGQDGAEGFADYDDERARWEQLQSDIVRRFGRSEVSLHQFLQELDLESKSSISEDCVRCMTIHGAKGLEFGHVYLIGMVEDQLPSFQAKKRGDDSREMEEERRNCFVAVTRVQSTLTMTFARQYNGWPKQPSRFLREMGLDPSQALMADPDPAGESRVARSHR
jgi:ATP-dependent DNA helicase UvrD/PcrA